MNLNWQKNRIKEEPLSLTVLCDRLKGKYNNFHWLTDAELRIIKMPKFSGLKVHQN